MRDTKVHCASMEFVCLTAGKEQRDDERSNLAVSTREEVIIILD